ncbi:Histidine triad (HIT) protein [Penicillium italicum]|uniref:Bis(5'-adenosyl)-triphosphatase n=1 Tax=Penicillium italicum TaxID=40296 RepID=A0A0A2KZL7_PENIT|nr:Histidine triad (HIT) protein [Penicillium italicum]
MSALKGATTPIYFGPFPVTPQVFHTTPLSFALVNLKPILPGHVLVSPRRVVPRVSDLTPAETSDFFLTVRRVGRMVERVHGATSLNIAIQDGVQAGQSVAHVHAHIIPRKAADLDHVGGTDAVYNLLDGEEGDLGKAFKTADPTAEGDQPTEVGNGNAANSGKKSRTPIVDNDAREPRNAEDMKAEAEMLAREMENEPLD